MRRGRGCDRRCQRRDAGREAAPAIPYPTRVTERPEPAGAGLFPSRAGLARRLFEPVDIASMIFFRVAFGLVLAWHAWRYIRDDLVREVFVEPRYLFAYDHFGWVERLPEAGMLALFYVTGALALCIALGEFAALPVEERVKRLREFGARGLECSLVGVVVSLIAKNAALVERGELHAEVLRTVAQRHEVDEVWIES